MTCKECRHQKWCPEKSREIPCKDFENIRRHTNNYDDRKNKKIQRAEIRIG